jgi:hypothetical protein
MRLLPLILLLALPVFGGISEAPPKGLMLNMDFEGVADGLIPSKTLYPMFVPQGDLGIEHVNYRNLLAFQYGQGLEIPHSYLLEPDGSEWIIIVRAFILTDGLVLSQCNEDFGLAIYLVDNAVQATIRTKHSAITLKESPDRGISKFRKKWVTIELRIKEDSAYLNLNRKRAAMVTTAGPLKGENMRIRLGNHNELPTVMKNIPGAQPVGFTGAISSLKVIRQ